MEPAAPATLQRRLVLALFLGGLILLAYRVLAFFLIPVAWAGILAYVTWPLYLRLRARLRERSGLSALLMTTALAMVLILPLVWSVLLLQTELALIYHKMAARVGQGPVVLPPTLHAIPWLGTQVEDFLNNITQDSTALQAQMKAWGEIASHHAGDIAGGVGKTLAKMLFTILTVFFFYRDGESVMQQVRTVLHNVLGERVDNYLYAMGATTRAVVYGIVLTALAQGLLAGLGYWVAGVPSPVFLGALTTLLALIPFGPPVAWGAICLWLLADGHFWAAFGLMLWGIFVVSWVDNIIRPMVISNATQIPFLLVMFGVLGGLTAFGMIGLFLGPVILALLIAVWREWQEERSV